MNFVVDILKNSNKIIYLGSNYHIDGKYQQADQTTQR